MPPGRIRRPRRAAACPIRPPGPRFLLGAQFCWRGWWPPSLPHARIKSRPGQSGARPGRSSRPCQTGDMTAGERHRAQAASFGAAAAAYERGRPPYPPQAVDWLLPEGAAHVLDLGAGTGKLTRQLLGRGLEVTAVEPLEEMREQLRQA